MTFQGFCIACQHGMHEDHVEWPYKPPPGVYGGHHCPCQGECKIPQKERTATLVENLIKLHEEAHRT